MSKDYVTLMQDALNNGEAWQQPWLSGVLDLNPHELMLFFKRKDGTSRCLEISPTTHDTDLEDLTNACDLAMFGRGHEDVLDESYRKAGKLDITDFSWSFNPESHSRFVSQLAAALFPFDTLKEGIRFEPYKLNVYGRGSFFKAHVDTPRAENMFGSLVLFLPFAHDGGILTLRHRGKELRFDAVQLLKNAKPASVAYVAFYSDVEHEVSEVESGHRVTMTFNLYFDKAKSVPPPLPVGEKLSLLPEHPFETIFAEYCEYLGFGLQHKYPVRGKRYDINDLVGEENRSPLSFLKGPDAIIADTLARHEFEPEIRYLYVDKCPDIPRVLRTSPYEADDTYSEIGTPDILAEGQEKCVVIDKGSRTKNFCLKEHFMYIKWVTEPTENVTGETPYLAYGNEAYLSALYFQVCLVAKVPYPLSTAYIPNILCM